MNEEKDLLRAASTMSFRQPLFDLIVQAKLVEEARAVDSAISDAPEPVTAFAEADEGAAKEAEDSSASGLNPNEPVQREALISAIERTIEADVSRWEEGASTLRAQRLEDEIVHRRAHGVGEDLTHV